MQLYMSQKLSASWSNPAYSPVGDWIEPLHISSFMKDIHVHFIANIQTVIFLLLKEICLKGGIYVTASDMWAVMTTSAVGQITAVWDLLR